MIDESVDQLSQVVSKGAALSALGVDRATWYAGTAAARYR